MSYTYFVLASESEVAELNTIDDIMSQMKNVEPLLGGDCFTLEVITSLCQIFLSGEKGRPNLTKYCWTDGSEFYVFGEDLCERVASTDWNDVLQASVPWSESDYWKNHKHNRMDLAGMIIDFAALCKQVKDATQLYFLLSNED